MPEGTSHQGWWQLGLCKGHAHSAAFVNTLRFEATRKCVNAARCPQARAARLLTAKGSSVI